MADHEPAVSPGGHEGQLDAGVHAQSVAAGQGGARPLCSAMGRLHLEYWELLHWGGWTEEAPEEPCSPQWLCDHVTLGEVQQYRREQYKNSFMHKSNFTD